MKRDWVEIGLKAALMIVTILYGVGSVWLLLGGGP